ncbi:MAG TPA: sulfite exporter TauE/SafE family protein [Acidocella sp.]|jgi:uncharacterized membrane protein YfcA|uniref:sulfite exporter TauE/SafE family protein n=1 Tax=Acidocella sp. TaxID=50710 RepID=UPI002CDAB3E0|nr:sulfite exporter TauE/SafE family protein [Acidocella sp.]HVE20953.1 sulfite exporter TauE/SafE family protein [Acidocella sp.]
MSLTFQIALGLSMVFASGLIRGFTGFGLSIAAVPLLSLIMPPAQAIPIVLLLQLLISLSGLRGALQICHWPDVRTLAIGAVIATPLGAWALARLPAAPVRIAIAVIVFGAVLVLAGGFRLKSGAGRHVLPFGLLSGLFNGLAGLPGPPVIAYFLMSPAGTAVARASMIVYFLATSVIALAPMTALGLIGPRSVAGALIGFPVAMAGSALGGRMFQSSPDAHYRFVALCLLGVAAGLAAIRALGAL